jgi:hypothetical protein
MDAFNHNTRKVCYLKIKGLGCVGFYVSAFHEVFFHTFVVVDCVKEKSCTKMFWVEPRQETH